MRCAECGRQATYRRIARDSWVRIRRKGTYHGWKGERICCGHCFWDDRVRVVQSDEVTVFHAMELRRGLGTPGWSDVRASRVVFRLRKRRS